MIESNTLSEMIVDTADVSITPDTQDTYWTDFSRMNELVRAGKECAISMLPEIKKAITKKCLGIEGFLINPL